MILATSNFFFIFLKKNPSITSLCGFLPLPLVAFLLHCVKQLCPQRRAVLQHHISICLNAGVVFKCLGRLSFCCP
jgi:hypothetical protein